MKKVMLLRNYHLPTMAIKLSGGLFVTWVAVLLLTLAVDGVNGTPALMKGLRPLSVFTGLILVTFRKTFLNMKDKNPGIKGKGYIEQSLIDKKPKIKEDKTKSKHPDCKNNQKPF